MYDYSTPVSNFEKLYTVNDRISVPPRISAPPPRISAPSQQSLNKSDRNVRIWTQMNAILIKRTIYVNLNQLNNFESLFTA